VYLLTPDILPIVDSLKPGYGGEIVLADAINQLAQEQAVYGKLIDGIWHDAGDKTRYLHAVIDHALADSKLGPGLQEYLKTRLNQ
jgi:UTP--glucose-1-phosphate uridylyltransferase